MNRLFQVISTAKPLSSYSFCRNILRCELYTVTFHVIKCERLFFRTTSPRSENEVESEFVKG